MPKKQNTEADTNEIEHPIEIVHKLYDLTDDRSDICTDRTWCFFNKLIFQDLTPVISPACQRGMTLMLHPPLYQRGARGVKNKIQRPLSVFIKGG